MRLSSRTTGGGGDAESLYDAPASAGARRIMLGALDDGAVPEIAADVLGAEPDRELLALAAAAGGNPLCWPSCSAACATRAPSRS